MYTNDNNQELIRKLAYDLLVRSNCRKLPIDLNSIIDCESKVYFYSYYYANRKYNVDIEVLREIFGNAFICYDTIYNHYNIFINTKVDSYVLLNTVAASIAYVELQMVSSDAWISVDDEQKEVYEFSRCVRAPNIILEECGITNNDEIMRATHLNFRDALYKERQLKRDKLFGRFIKQISAIEEILIGRFKKYIEYYRTQDTL